MFTPIAKRKGRHKSGNRGIPGTALSCTPIIATKRRARLMRLPKTAKAGNG